MLRLRLFQMAATASIRRVSGQTRERLASAWQPCRRKWRNSKPVNNVLPTPVSVPVMNMMRELRGVLTVHAGEAFFSPEIARRFGTTPDCVVHLPGTSMANFVALAGLLSPGDDVVAESPTYELIVSAARFLGANVVSFIRRPEDEFRTGHIPGAVSIPVSELERRLSELPAGKEVVAYCRGRYCVLAVRALEILTGRGVRARRLDAGVPDWARLGFDVARAGGA